jgi:hypothetical protein
MSVHGAMHRQCSAEPLQSLSRDILPALSYRHTPQPRTPHWLASQLRQPILFVLRSFLLDASQSVAQRRG